MVAQCRRGQRQGKDMAGKALSLIEAEIHIHKEEDE
jgi:hypothetical protein